MKPVSEANAPDKPRVDLDEVEKFHQKNVLNGCCGCEQDWPCDAIKLAAEVRGLRKALERRFAAAIRAKPAQR